MALNIGGFVDGKAQQPLPKSLKSHEKQIGKSWTTATLSATRF